MTNSMKRLREHCFSQLHISPKELELLRLCADLDATAEAVAAYYQSVDFEALGSQRVCALAELSARLEYRGVPRELLARVRGLIRYHTARNTAQMQEFYRLLKLYNAHGIPVMLMKGGAMRAFHMPRVIRWMGDVDFCVRYEDFDRACALAQESGVYECYPYSHHMGLKHGENMLEMHVSYLKENQGKNNEEIFWQEAVESTLLGEKVYIPTSEAMLLSILTNIFGDCIRGNLYSTIWMRWAMDCKWLITRNEIDWDKLIQRCRDYSVTLAVRTMLTILNDIFPSTVEQSVLGTLQVSETESRKIVWMFRMNKSFFAARESKGGKRLHFAWWSFHHQWYKHRILGGGKCWLSDLVRFPGYIKGLWRCKTWRQFAAHLWRKLRDPNRSISTQ